MPDTSGCQLSLLFPECHDHCWNDFDTKRGGKSPTSLSGRVCNYDVHWHEISVGFSPGREQGCGHHWIDHLENMQTKSNKRYDPMAAFSSGTRAVSFLINSLNLLILVTFFPEEFIKQRSPCPHRIGSVGAKTLYDGQMPWFGIHLRCEHLDRWRNWFLHLCALSLKATIWATFNAVYLMWI